MSLFLQLSIDRHRSISTDRQAHSQRLIFLTLNVVVVFKLQ